MKVYIIISGSFGFPQEDMIMSTFSKIENAFAFAFNNILEKKGSEITVHNLPNDLIGCYAPHSFFTNDYISNGIMNGSQYGFTYKPHYGDVKSYRMIVESELL